MDKEVRQQVRTRNTLGRKGILATLILIVVWAACSLSRQAYAQSASVRKQTSKTAKKDPYRRPDPTVKIKPEIPAVDRYNPNKVFLEKADSLFRPANDPFGPQIVTGNVVFRQGGMWMYCDSAYYYQNRNSLDAFGHVKMTQGDTLFVYADVLYYDGIARNARLRKGPSQPKVVMKNRKVSLTTDSLEYDLVSERGWYNCGGLLEDDVNTLTSREGIYSPYTKDAEFYYDVVLTNNKDGYKLLSDTLFYNTATHVARIVTPTRIFGENDTILSSSGTYNTVSGNADLSSRSTIIHRDSSGNVTTLVGDSIIYDKLSRISRAYSFSPGSRNRSLPMVITDTARHSILIGGYGEYNDLTGAAMACAYPLLKEFSRPDTIYLRADTIRTLLADVKVPVNNPDSLVSPPDSVMKQMRIAKAYPRARFFRIDVQGIADSITFLEQDSILYMDRGPIVWSGERQISGNSIRVHLNDSTADWALLPDYGMLMEHVDEDFYNQLAGRRILARFENENIRQLDMEGNVQTIFLPQEKDSTFNRLVTAESSNLTALFAEKTIERLKMWPEVTGDFTPIFLVKRSQKFLPGAVWRGELRPQKIWLDSRWSWDDNLGELSPELELYFKAIQNPPASN